MSWWTNIRNDIEKVAPYVAGGAAAIFAPELLGALGSFGGAAAGAAEAGTNLFAADAASYLAGAGGAGLAGDALGATAFNPAVDSQLASSALGITGADAAAAATVPGGVDLGSLGGIMSTGLGVGSATTPASFLPVTGTGGATGMAPLTPQLAQQFGVAPGVMPSGGGFDATASFADPLASIGGSANPAVDLSGAAAPGGAPTSGGGFLDQAGNWIKNNPVTAGMLGVSAINGLRTPQLPSAAKTALNAAGPAVQQAQQTISSRGASGPLWQSQKASIDSQISQQLNTAIEQIKQAAANNGMGGANSMVVQQQIAHMQQQAVTQAQQLYAQAQQQNVANAVAELSGGNATLGSIAQMQMTQSNEAKQAASQTAELALLLSGKQTPAATTPG